MSNLKPASEEDRKTSPSVQSIPFISKILKKKKLALFCAVWVKPVLRLTLLPGLFLRLFLWWMVKYLKDWDRQTHSAPAPCFARTTALHCCCAVYPPVMASLPRITTLGSVFVNSQERMSTGKIFTQLLCCGITPVMPFQEDHTLFLRFVLQKPKKLWHFSACNTSPQITTFQRQ